MPSITGTGNTQFITVGYNDPWQWTGTITTAATTTNDWYIPTWQSWNTTTTTTGYNTVAWQSWVVTGPTSQPVVEETEVERALRLEREAAMRAQRHAELRERHLQASAEFEERTKRLEAAAATAMELLRVFLTDEQEKSMDENHFFEVIGRREDGSRGHRWRIYTANSYSGNVALMPDIGEVRDASYCAHLPARDRQGRDIPRPDHWLAQKLALETNEDAWIAVANVHYRSSNPSQEIPSRFTREAAQPPRNVENGVLAA